MNKELNFSRNIYIILAAILIFAIVIQLTRSQFILKFNENNRLIQERQELLANLQSTEKGVPEGAPYCLGYLSGDEGSVSLKNNAARALQYMQKPIAEKDLSKDPINPEGCASVLIATEKLDRLGDIRVVSDYVSGGGHVFFMITPEIDDNFLLLYRKLGILSFSDQYVSMGIKMTSNVLIGEKGLQVDEGIVANSSIILDLDDESELLAESGDGMPLLWKRDYGKGAFIVFNGTMMEEKVNRGLIAGSVSLLEPDFIYPIFNSKIFFIDDFPAPVPKGINAQIYRAYNRDIPSFFRDIWWPDMLKAAKQFDVKYTAVLIQSYNNRVEPPFHAPVDEDHYELIAYGREVIKSGGEIGVHGYNHQSLQMSKRTADNFGYIAWNSPIKMQQSIEEVLSYSEKAFPNYKVLSYVPPSNVLSSEGRDALKKAWPNLTVISSLYNTDEDGFAYVQEFEIAPDGIIEMPRVTSNYTELPYDRWVEANTMTSLGVFSHFIHPDDLLDSERSYNKDWEGLYEGFTSNLKRISKTYPWLRPMTSAEGALDMAAALQSSVTWTHSDNRITGQVNNFQRNLYYVLRTERKIAKLENCSVRKIDDNTYLVEAQEASFSIGLGG
jgi:hypothetical protein